MAKTSTSNRAKAKAKPDNSAQYKRFLETAKEVGASDDPRALENALKKSFLRRESRGEPVVKKVSPAKKRLPPSGS
jgi:hypothetical protein